MAFTSPYGFDGTVTEGEPFAHLTSGPADYHVGGVFGASGDCRVTIVSGVDRTVRVATGLAYGKGVGGENDATVDVQLGTISSGTRWDTIVLRRNTATNAVTAIAIAGTATQAISTSRTENYVSGDTDDQPIALARVVAGQSNVQEVVDLRVWAANGGVFAVSEFAKDYLTTPGARLTLTDGRSLVRTTDGAGTDQWRTEYPVFGSTGWVSPTTWGLNYGTNSTFRTWMTTAYGWSDIMAEGILKPASGSIGQGRTGSVGVAAHPPVGRSVFLPAAGRVFDGTNYNAYPAHVEIATSGNMYIHNRTGSQSFTDVSVSATFRKGA